MCCSPHSQGSKGTAKCLTRVAFGLTLLLMGIAYYIKLDSFVSLMSEGLADSSIAPLGMAMAYVLPALMIIGGLLNTLGLWMTLGAWTAGLAIGLFTVMMMLKAVVSPAIEPTSVMPFVVYGLAWLLVYKMVSGGGKSCGSGCGVGCMPGGECGGADCNCGSGSVCPMCGKDPCRCGMPVKATSSVKSASKTSAKKRR